MAYLEYMSRVVRKLAFYICENKDADQLCGNRRTAWFVSDLVVNPEDRFSHNVAHIKNQILKVHEHNYNHEHIFI